MRVLVIDDSRAMRSILRKIMTEVGFEVIEAEHGRHGLEQLEEAGSIELALVDWNLPEMNGFEFVCSVRSNPAYDDMRLIMVTTETEKSQIRSALEAGADEYIMKPFTKDTILEKLAMIGLNPD
jgi:two-component system chemotaxis response regulator CheY